MATLGFISARPRACRWFVGLGVASAVAYQLLPIAAAKLVVWPIIGWSSVIAILIGVRRNRPGERLAWYLLASGVATFILGDYLYSFHSFVQHGEREFPSHVDAIYLAMYPLLFAGLVRMVRRRSAGRDQASMMVASIITAALGLVVWVFLIAPYARATDIGLLERLVSMAYPLGDVALLAVVIRLAIGAGRRPIGFWLLAVSLVSLLVADSLYGYLSLAGDWTDHGKTDLLWIVFYVGWGAAALHPSMRELTNPSGAPRVGPARRLVIVGAAVLVPPTVLFVQQASGEVVDGAAIAIVSALLFLLVMIRIAGLAGEDAARRTESRFRALIDHASDAIVVLDTVGTVRYHTPSTTRVLGCDPALLDEHPSFADLLDHTGVEQLYRILTNPGANATVEWRIHHADRGWRDLEVIAADMREEEGVDGVVLTMRDITERKQLDAELRRQALHDGLTHLPNRTLFLDRLVHGLASAQRRGESVGVLFLDLDDFKNVNDSFGHAAGDEVLIAVAARLESVARVGDTVARFGGDEFAVLIEGAQVATQIEGIAERVLHALHEPIAVGAERVRVRASIGLVVGQAATHPPGDLLRDADTAMYVAKRNGKGRYETFDPEMHDHARRLFETAAELRSAIDREEFVVHYQPIVDVRTGVACGAEALVRWQHPARGLLQPREFVHVAETSGLIVPLGRWVLAQACVQAERWKRDGVVDDGFYISVNLSGGHVQDAHVIEHVADALQRSQLDPSSLVLEVTETTLIADLESTSSVLTQLKQLGLRLALDDFGTGYSSLSYLSMFPVDILKVDKSFIDKLTSSGEDAAIVRAVLDMASTLGLIAVAEGVEEPEQAHALERLGCTVVQGYLFARPTPVAAFAAALQSATGTARSIHRESTTRRRAPDADGDDSRALATPANRR